METRFAGPGQPAALLGRARECAVLDEFLAAVRGGESRSLVLCGEAGIGKTALLEYLLRSASDLRVLSAAGVESEMELAYAGLHLLCAPLLDRLARLPPPQCRALEIVFGLRDGEPPDRLLVGLAVLSLFSEAGEKRPLLCLIDDAGWLDRASTLTLAFAARRLHADSVGIVFATREPAPELDHLPELIVEGLRSDDARGLLNAAVKIKLDARVREQIIVETHGNPLALLELPRGLTPTDLAGGFGLLGARTLAGQIEESFLRRLAALSGDAQRLLLLAAADPLGDPLLLLRAGERLGITLASVYPETDGLLAIEARVTFRHPLVRSAVYRTAAAEERQAAHLALAEAIDAGVDPDRRAWHRALATDGLDDDVADELARSAARAQARGGQPAAAAFLERSMCLSSDPARRAERALAAAEAMYLAGSAEDALRLAALAEQGPLSEPGRVSLDGLRGRVATMQRRPRDATKLLLGAAQRLEQLDRRLARETYRRAFLAAIYTGRLAGDTGLTEVARAVRQAASANPPSATDELLDAAALLIDAGYAAGAPAARRALAAAGVALASRELDLRWLFFAVRVLAQYLWDSAAWDALSGRLLERVRDGAVLALLPEAASQRIGWELFAGDFDAAAAHVVEQDTVQEAIGGERSPGSRIALAAFSGNEADVSRLDEATTRDAEERGDGTWVAVLHWSTAVLCNGVGRYDRALAAAQLAASCPADMQVSNWALTELVEAAVRCGRPEAASDALGRIAEMARACGTDWIVGVDARARALVAGPNAADGLYRRAIEHLRRTPLRTEVARAHLLYGEWLRRVDRRAEAREQVRTAHDQLTSIGMEAFAERARMELLATGAQVRKRAVETRDDLTDQEHEIAQLAAGGLSNAEIGARLFLSPRTVEWHLRKVFTKLGVRSRRELSSALSKSGSRLVPA